MMTVSIPTIEKRQPPSNQRQVEQLRLPSYRQMNYWPSSYYAPEKALAEGSRFYNNNHASATEAFYPSSSASLPVKPSIAETPRASQPSEKAFRSSPSAPRPELPVKKALTPEERDEEALIKLFRELIQKNPELRSFLEPGSIEKLANMREDPKKLKDALVRYLVKSPLGENTRKHMKEQGLLNKLTGGLTERMVLKAMPSQLDGIAEEFFKQVKQSA